MVVSPFRIKIKHVNQVRSILNSRGLDLQFCKSDFNYYVVKHNGKFEFDTILGLIDNWKQIIKNYENRT